MGNYMQKEWWMNKGYSLEEATCSHKKTQYAI